MQIATASAIIAFVVTLKPILYLLRRCSDHTPPQAVAGTIATNAVLPNPRYAGHWDAIVVDQDAKNRLLNQALLALRLRTDAIDFTAIAMHGLIALQDDAVGLYCRAALLQAGA